MLRPDDFLVRDDVEPEVARQRKARLTRARMAVEGAGDAALHVGRVPRLHPLEFTSAAASAGPSCRPKLSERLGGLSSLAKRATLVQSAERAVGRCCSATHPSSPS